MRRATWIGGLCGLVCSVAAAQATPPASWIIVLAWSPEYCKANIGSKEPQCLEEHYFELASLAPHFDPGTPQPECRDTSLPEEALARGLQALPNKAQLKKAWRKDGACSGLVAAEYVLQLERAARRVTIPEAYRQIEEATLKTTVNALKDAFARENPGLVPEALVPRCRGGWLSEIKLCVDGGFDFARCPVDVGEACAENLRMRPLRPALRSARKRAESAP